MTRYAPPRYAKIVSQTIDAVCPACGERIQEVMGSPYQDPIKRARTDGGVRVSDNFEVIERSCTGCHKPFGGEPTHKKRAFDMRRFPHLKSQYATRFGTRFEF